MSVSYSDKLKDLVAKVENEFLRSALYHCKGRNKLPVECMVDGAVDRMINEILKLEKDAKSWRDHVANANQKGNG